MLNGTFRDPVAFIAMYNVTQSFDFMLFVPLTLFPSYAHRSVWVINGNLAQFHPCYKHFLDGSEKFLLAALLYHQQLQLNQHLLPRQADV